MKRKLIPITLLLALASVARATDYIPIPLTPSSFNQDMVVEKTAPRPLIPGGATTASMDGGIANNNDTWNEQGYFDSDPGVGLPPAGTTISTNNHQFTFAPSYTANNAIMLDADYFTNANWKVTTPAAYAKLSFLTSGGNGGAQFRYTVSHQDGTTEAGITNSADWFFVDQNIAWIANGRVNAQSFVLDNYNSANPRLYAIDVPLSGSSSPITNIFIERTGGNAGGHTCIMAISGAATANGPFTPILGTGYTADIVVEATAAKRWNLTPPGSVPSTATMDGGLNNNNNTWFEQGYYTRSNSFGIPAAGSTLTNQSAADHRYLMPADYTVNNAVFLDPGLFSTTITPVTPAAFSALSFLAAAGNGPVSIQCVINHQNGTSETNTLNVPDWFGATPAWTANGRMNVTSGVFENLNSGNPRLAGVDMVLNNASSPITSIDLSYVSTGGRAIILALSGAAGPVPPVFVTQPQSLATNAGSAAQLSAVVSSTATLTYRWQKGIGGVFTDIPGATATALNFASLADADEAQYRLIASNVAGSATSAVANLVVYSALAAVTVPGDSIVAYQPNGGSSPSGENVTHAIDNSTSKYLNFGATYTGFIVTPSKGRTIVTVMRLYSANDAPERDPANYILEGSNDGGSTYTLISSNAIRLPDARNNSGQGLDPANQAVLQVRFVNTNSYSMYRWYQTQLKTPGTTLMQIGEVELLGVVDTSGLPTVLTQPNNTAGYVGSTAQFSVVGTGTPAPAYQWFKGTNALKDGPNISGATTPTLNLSNLAFGDAGSYHVVLSNSVTSISSATVTLTVVSTLTDVTQPGDEITSFGDQSGTFYGTETNALNGIFNSTAKWLNGGSGFSAAAGFPPFKGPVGLIIHPTAGTGAPTNTLVTGLRIYTADGNPERDPADYTLEGSNDGTTFTVISRGALNLPLERNDTTSLIDPLTLAMQEVLFPNIASFSTYRLTFNHVRNDATASSLQFAELELLGVVAAPNPVLSFTRTSDGKLIITTTLPGTLQSTTAFQGASTVWTSEGPISGSVTITPAKNQAAKFYRVVSQ